MTLGNVSETLAATGFATLFLGTAALRWWLLTRQRRHLESNRDHPPADFSATISPEAHAKAARYGSDKAGLARWSVAVDLAMLLAITWGGGLDLLSGWSEALAASSIAQGLMLFVLVAIAFSLVDLPFAWYRQFVLEARHGFNRMTPSLFLADLARSTLLAAAFGIPLAAAALALMASAGALWWLWLWGLWTAFNVAMLWVFPMWIAPLFNRFEPLRDEALAQRISSLLQRCGFRASGLYVMDGSKRSSHGNAYFTGFGASRRIVFFDTLLKTLSPAQVEAVLAHELGHFRHRHVIKRIAASIAAAAVALAVLGLLRDSPEFFNALGVTRISDASALIVFALVLPQFLLPAQPLLNGLSRQHEFEADSYAAQQTSAEDLIAALLKLYRDNAVPVEPDPVHSLFFDSHPPAATRIDHLRAPA